jgi:hypothetical protein
MKRLTAGFATLSTLLIFCCISICSAASNDEAWQAMESAESELASAYVAVAEAQGAGANVTELVSRLELAGALLTNARNAHAAGKYDESYSFAVDCSNGVRGIAYEASNLKSQAQTSSYGRLFLTAAISGVALCAFVISCFFGWRFFRKRYTKRLLDLKPEVGNSV